MRNVLHNLENTFSAAAFAEAGEFETAKQIMDEVRTEKRHRVGMFERLMMAVTFAEAGEHDTARDIMSEGKRIQKQDRASRRPRHQLRAS